MKKTLNGSNLKPLDISIDSNSEDSMNVLVPSCPSSPTDNGEANHLENHQVLCQWRVKTLLVDNRYHLSIHLPTITRFPRRILMEENFQLATLRLASFLLQHRKKHEVLQILIVLTIQA